MCAWGTGCAHCVNKGRPTARVIRQSGNGVEQLHPVPECCDAKLLQVLVRQAREDRLVYLILAECRLILPEAQAPQPDHDVHDSAPNSGLSSFRLGGVSRRPETAADRWFRCHGARIYPSANQCQGAIENCARTA